MSYYTNMSNSFSISEALSFGWDTTKKNLGFLVGVSLVAYLLPQIVVGIFGGDPDSSSASLWNFLSSIYSMIISIGMITISLKFVRGKQAEWADLFNGYALFFNYLVGMILYGLMVLLGFIALIIPGIYLALKYQFVGYFIVDKKMGPIDALKASGEATKGELMHLLGTSFAFMGVTLLGFLALILGIFVAMPVVMLAYAFIFEKLSKDIAIPGEVVISKKK